MLETADMRTKPKAKRSVFIGGTPFLSFRRTNTNTENISRFSGLLLISASFRRQLTKQRATFRCFRTVLES
jgi:hypothetical protein